MVRKIITPLDLHHFSVDLNKGLKKTLKFRLEIPPNSLFLLQ